MKQHSSPLPVREEYKYFVPVQQYPYLLQDLKLFMKADKYVPSKQQHYSVSSIYFENSQLQSYLTKVNGLAKRYKLRIRSYPESVSSDSFVEIKYKLYDKFLKKRVIVDQSTLTKFLSHAPVGVFHLINSNRHLAHALRYLQLHQLIPFIQIDYRRNALLEKVDTNVRMTFDFDICCGRYQVHMPVRPHIPVLQGAVILEIKTMGYFPFWLTNIVRSYGLRRSTISKYVLSVQRVALNSSMYVR